MTRLARRDGFAATAPLAGACLAVVAATAYALVLGHAPETGPASETARFVLYFGGLGAGVAFAGRRFPVAAGVGVLLGATWPVLVSGFGVVPMEWPYPFTTLYRAGGLAFGGFLAALCWEAAVFDAVDLRTLARARGTYAGLAIAVPTVTWIFALSTPAPVVFHSMIVHAIYQVTVLLRAAALVAALLVAVLFLTRRLVVAPALLGGWTVASAAIPTGGEPSVLAANPDFLVGHAFSLPVLLAAVGLVELACRAAVYGSWTGVRGLATG